ncbi:MULTISPECIES: protein kinase domain-containing protein [unclassified Blastococcus]
MTTVEQGRRLLGGRYELQERIAAGGMGEVWRGRDVVLQRDVAVKVLRSEYADDPTFVERFRAEARHAAALNHPNIAAVLDYGEACPEEAGEHLAFLVMELVEGAPLSARLAAEGPMDPEDALSVLQQAAAGLAEAHRRGVVHRDVKPSNILVRPDGAVKLTDFGIARSADSVPLTGTGQVVGTAQYMSPEQAQGEPATPASDVYALGLVGYETLTGHAAFEGTNPVTVALKHVVADPEPLPAELPEEVRDLIGSALAKDPGERIPDGAAFLSAVRETVGPGTASSPGLAIPGAARASDTRPARLPRPAGASRSPVSGRPARRRRTLLLLLPLVVLLVGAGALALALAGPAAGPGADAAERPSAAADRGVVLTAEQYVGRPFDEVAGELTGLGLTVVRVEQVTGDHPPGTVTALDPAGTRLDAGDEVRVTAAVAPPEEALPEAPQAPAGTGGGASAPVDPDPSSGPAEEPADEAPAPPADQAPDPVTSAEPTAPAETATSPAPDTTAPPAPSEPSGGTTQPPATGGETGGETPGGPTGGGTAEPPAPEPVPSETAGTAPAPAGTTAAG